MKPTMTVLVCLLAASLASAQSPSIIQNTRTTMNSISSQQTAATNEALRQSAPDAVINTHVSAKASPITVTTPVKSSSGKSKVAVVGVGVKRGAHAKAAVVTKATATKVTTTKATAPKTEAAATAPVAVNVATAGAAPADSGDSKPALDSKYNANGRRDPFISPVVSHANGSGCSTGKKCLEIGAINLRGVVHSENGFIAVVSNDLNKAYFLRENDPVFNGYVVKITGDSIVFQETLQDRLGKSFTREVVKKITTPAV
jgi:hypothetical protein